jgi:hypothetical protein
LEVNIKQAEDSNLVDTTTLEIIDKTATQLGVEKVPVSWKGLVAVQEEIIRPDVLRSGIFCHRIVVKSLTLPQQTVAVGKVSQSI